MIARETCRIILPVTLHTKRVKPSTVDVEMHYYQQEIKMVKVVQAIYITLIPRWPLNSSHEVLSEAAAYHSHSWLQHYQKSQIPSRNAGLFILQEHLEVPELACQAREKAFSLRLLKTVLF